MKHYLLAKNKHIPSWTELKRAAAAKSSRTTLAQGAEQKVQRPGSACAAQLRRRRRKRSRGVRGRSPGGCTRRGLEIAHGGGNRWRGERWRQGRRHRRGWTNRGMRRRGATWRHRCCRLTSRPLRFNSWCLTGAPAFSVANSRGAHARAMLA